MSHRPALLPCLLFLLPSLAWSGDAKTRIDPAGIQGALVLVGPGKAPEEAIDRFLKLVGAAKGDWVLVEGAEKANPSLWEKAKSHILKGEEIRKDGADVSGVWLEPEDAALVRKRLRGSLGDLCRGVLKRGGVVAAAGKSTEALDVLFPDTLIAGRVPEANHAGRVAYVIGEGAALLVRGRTMSSLSKEAVTIQLAASKTLAARTIRLEGKKQEDLTALRRAALARTLPAFPPEKCPEPVVEKGTLVIVGGGGFPPGLVTRFVELAGGKDAKIVVLPTANPDPLPDKGGELFTKAGTGKVTVLKSRLLADVASDKYLEAFKEATGVWFGGGRQWRFVDAYEDTKALELMRDVLRRGGVIGGTSAGATIQGDYLCRASPFENFSMMYEGYERGFAFLPGTAIDQHFTQRKRFGDMSVLIRAHPQLLGIGIDEATALIVRGHVAEITGKGKAHFYDARRVRKIGAADHDALSNGERYDLRARRVMEGN